MDTTTLLMLALIGLEVGIALLTVLIVYYMVDYMIDKKMKLLKDEVAALRKAKEDEE